MRASARHPARKILPLLANGARQFLAERLEPRSLFSSYGLTAIASLPALTTSNPNASNNTPVIRDSAGNLYGIDPNGGPNGAGTIFKVDATTHALTPLVSFDGTNGVNPVQIALDSHGNIFGVTHFDNFANGQAGASEGSGVLFEIPANNQTTVQTIYAFTDNSIGQFPQALVLDSSDNIYCLTTYGGANNAGSIVKIAAGTFSVSTVASLPGSFQSEPNSLTLANGNFYGTTLTGGGSDLGTFFELPASTTTFNVASFTGTANGASPDGAPLVDANGNIYGTTEGGGANGLGTIYQYSVSSNTLTAVASVPGALGSNLVGNLVEDSSGDLYGAIQRSGTDGAIYELNGQTLQFISLAQFNLTNGGNPLSGLVADSSGNFYGITFTGGANSTGAFYEASPGAAETAPTGDFAVSAPAGKFPGAVLAGAKQVGGATVQITYNGTVTLTNATVTTTLYASLTQIHDSSSVQVGAAVTTKVATLKRGQSFKIPFAPFNYPTAAEDYYLVSDVALNGTLDSYDSATSSPITVAAPFLAFSETVTTTGLASSVVSGTKSTAMAKVVIVNNGNIAAKGSTVVDLSASTASGVTGTAINSVTSHAPIPANGGKATVLVPFKALPNLADNSYYITATVTDPNGGTSVASTAGATTIAAPFISLALAFGSIPKAVLTSGAPLIITNSGNIDDTSTFTATIGFSTDSAGMNIVGTNAGALAPAKLTVRAGKSGTIHITGLDPLFKSLVTSGPFFLTVTLTDANGNTASVVSTGEI